MWDVTTSSLVKGYKIVAGTCCCLLQSRGVIPEDEEAVYPKTPVSFYRGADKSLALPTSRCILFDGENISFDASLVLYIYIYIYTSYKKYKYSSNYDNKQDI